MLNKTMIIGRLGKDPEIKYAQNGNAIANFSVAVDDSYKDKDGNKIERTEWVNIVVFGKQAENCERYIGKGSLVHIEGSLTTEKWQDKDGKDRCTTKVKASSVLFLDKRQQAEPSQSAPARQTQQHDMPEFPSESTGMDDVPF